MVLTPETVQGGQDAVPGYGCNMPPTRLVLPPWFPNWPLTNRASWSGAARSTGYELAGHGRPEQRGTALDRYQNATTFAPTSIKSSSQAPRSRYARVSEIAFGARAGGTELAALPPRDPSRSVALDSPRAFEGESPFTPTVLQGSRWR